MSANSFVAQRLRLHLPAFSIVAIWLSALFILTWLSAEWFWRANAPDPVVLPTQTISDPLLAAQAIVSRHLMGVPQLTSTGSAGQGRNQYQLTGAMTASKGRRGFAVFAEDGQQPLAVMEGEELAPGVILYKVFASKVEITRQGRLEVLEINDKSILRIGNEISAETGAKIPENVTATSAPGGRPQ